MAKRPCRTQPTVDYYLEQLRHQPVATVREQIERDKRMCDQREEARVKKNYSRKSMIE